LQAASTSPSTRQERRKQRTTDAILEAGERLFQERGYAATTIEAVAEAADVAIGSIYARFAGKEGLYLALVERVLEINEAYLDDAYSSATSPAAKIEAAGAAYVRFHADHPLAFRIVALRDLDPSADARLQESRARIAALLNGMLNALAGVIRSGVKSGDFRPVDARATATYLWGSWNGAIALRQRGALDDREMARTLRAGRDLTRTGLAPR
jgi:TetR/AcrR family transcriptional regulator